MRVHRVKECDDERAGACRHEEANGVRAVSNPTAKSLAEEIDANAEQADGNPLGLRGLAERIDDIEAAYKEVRNTIATDAEVDRQLFDRARERICALEDAIRAAAGITDVELNKLTEANDELRLRVDEVEKSVSQLVTNESTNSRRITILSDRLDRREAFLDQLAMRLGAVITIIALIALGYLIGVYA